MHAVSQARNKGDIARVVYVCMYVRTYIRVQHRDRIAITRNVAEALAIEIRLNRKYVNTIRKLLRSLISRVRHRDNISVRAR